MQQTTARNRAARLDAPATGPSSGPATGDDTGALAAVIRRLASARSLEEVMSVVTFGVRSLLHADGATFVLRDRDRCYYAEEDAISPLWKGRRFPMSICISGWVMLHHEPAVIHDIYADPRIPVGAYRPTFVRSMAMAPVGVEEPIAALGAYWSMTREIRPEEIELLQTIANAAALAVAYVQAQTAARPPKAPARRARKPRTDAPPREDANRGWFARWSADLRREGLPSSLPASLGFAVVCVLLAAVARGGVDAAGVSGLTPFATFYPATLFVLLVGGTRAAVLAGLLGGLIAFWAFLPPKFEFAGLNATAILDLALYFGATTLMIWMLNRYRRSVRRLMQEDARLVTLAREQHHRVVNAVSVVETIVRQSLRHAPLEARSINQRIRAGLADIDIRPRGDARPTALRTLLSEHLQPFDLERFRLAGADETPLAPELCSLFTLAAHELATNALKYGALSNADGEVVVDWRIAEGRATLVWREQGGPPVQPTSERGFGSILLNRLVTAAKGSFTREFAPGGLAAELSLPLSPAH